MKIKNISKKALAVVMSLAVLASALMLNTFSAFATGPAPSTGAWDGTEATAFAGGKGTAADPYQIATAEQFALFGKYMVEKTEDTANPVNNLPYCYKAFILTADILLNDVKSEAWAALTAGKATAEQLETLKQWTYGKTGNGGDFGGVLDGNYHTLKGMYIDAENDNAGLIPRVSYGSTVKNLGIESSFIRTTLTGKYEKAATAIFAQTNNWQGGNHLVENCYLADTVTIKAVDEGGNGTAMAGSFYGDNAVDNDTLKTTIRNCYTKAVVEGEIKGSFVASWWNTAKLGLQVINSYATQTGMNIVGRVGSGETTGPALKNNVLCTNTYSAGTNSIRVNGGGANDSDWGNKSFRDVTLLTLSQMNGKRVTETMPGLFGTDSLWVAVDGNTPQLKDFALANGTPDVWNGTVATGFAKGSGSSTDPYQIATAEEFAYFGTLLFTFSATDGKYFELTNDIYLNDINSSAWQKLMADNEAGLTEEERATLNEWNVETGRDKGVTPQFNGHFDGDYHVIKGFYTNSNYQFISPFGKMGWSFRGLKNLGIESSYISSTWDVFSDSGKNGTGYVAPFFSNTHNVLDGGIKSKSIENCYAADSVILKGQLVGCFIGQSEINPDSVTTDVEIKNCYTSAQSTSTAKEWGSPRHASFIAGYYYAAGFKFTNCYSTCNLPIFTGVEGEKYNNYNTEDNNYRASTSCTNCYALQDDAKYLGFKKLTSGYMYGIKAKSSMSDLFGKDSPWVALFGNTPKLKAFGYEVLTMWDGETTYAPMAVSDTNPGTEQNPYLIYDAAELAYVADQIQNGNVSSYYELREDIYLNDITDPDWQNLVSVKSVDKDKLAKFNQWDYGNCTGNDGRYGLSG
ncbi:MAG: hypothetical protein U0K70_07390, partial [Acutalibacteraceae bacterium]|nr:hypothetical protein [Acutalibacteraceae bacterium]